MAEGGIGYHRDTSSSNAETHSLGSRLLECPICLEHLRQPKSLPCLHCFCQDCLCTFITEEPNGNMSTSFSCPVCRRVTQPVDPTEKRENWAKRIPTNSLIQELIQQQTKSLDPLYCKSCSKKGNMETPAKVWCKSLNMFFCEGCKENVHDLIHDECEAVVTTGTDVHQTRGLPAAIKCSKHQEKIDYYCEDHKILGCTKCITVEHRRCEVVTTTEEYCELLKSSSQQNNLLESLQTSADAIEILMKDFSEQIKTLVKQQDSGLKTIRELRKQINQCLDGIEKELSDELITAVKKEKINIEITSQQCERLQTSILKTIESSKSETLGNGNVEKILLYQRGQSEDEICKDLLTEIGKAYTSVSVKHVIDPEQNNIEDDNRLDLGKIKIEKEPRQLPSGVEYLKPPLFDCCVKEKRKFCIKTPSDSMDCDAVGLVYLPDDYIVVGDYNNRKLKLYTDNGQFLDELKTEGDPWDICMVDNNTAAVAVSWPGSLLVVNVKSSKLSLLYSIISPLDDHFFGVTHRDGNFVVSTGTQVYNMIRDGEPKLIFTLPVNCYSLTSDPKHGHIYASQCTDTTGKTAVYRISGDTQTDIMKVGVAKCAWGVDVDAEGNVYICSKKSHNIVQTSGDGTHVRELFTSSDGVIKPQAIAICGDKFAVTTLGDWNYVRVYQLS